MSITELIKDTKQFDMRLFYLLRNLFKSVVTSISNRLSLLLFLSLLNLTSLWKNMLIKVNPSNSLACLTFLILIITSTVQFTVISGLFQLSF